jgi:uncharacterized protein (TIGR01777 family)
MQAESVDHHDAGRVTTGGNSMERVLVSGASGLIGDALVPSLEQAGAEVVRLVRGPARSSSQLSWDPKAALPPEAVSGFEVVVHLAGESIVGRWTDAKKRAVRDSRVQGTKTLASALAQSKLKPRVFVCASAIGFYGNRGEELLTEESASGQGFLSEVCREWEAASRIAAEAGIRTVNLRTGLVLSAQGGALAKMLPAFRFGLGGRLGAGTQWWSWIHINDMVGAIHHAMRDASVSGPLNTVSPAPLPNAEFTKVLASVLGRPAFFPVPGAVLKLAFGVSAAQELFLASQRVAPAKLHASSYAFQFGDLRAALENLI